MCLFQEYFMELIITGILIGVATAIAVKAKAPVLKPVPVRKK